jgi:hypothetical protein
MLTPKFNVITSMSAEYFNKSGKTMLDSFIKNWPENISITIYTEEMDGLILPYHPKYTIQRLHYVEPELTSFLERHKDRPDQQNPKELHQGAVRFSYKTFSIINACLNSGADYIIWLDADTFTHSKVTMEFLLSLVDPKKYLTYLGRDNNYSECGFVIYNVKHPANRMFMESWKLLYTSDNLFKLAQWHDSYVFDFLRIHYENNHVISNTNLSPWGKDYDHVFINSVLGEYIDHMKGDRKDEGKSNNSDLFSYKQAEYWSNK